MGWDPSLIRALNAALNEATVRGIDYIGARDEVRLLVDVCALPAEGPMDADPRRVLVLCEVAVIEVVLRTDRSSERPAYGPVIPLANMADVAEFASSLSWMHPMCGWDFIDTEGFRTDFPSTPSLAVRAPALRPAHSLFWFTECGRQEGRASVAYCLEGVVYFQALRVERADGSPVPVVEFAEDGERWWKAFFQHDARVSVQAQREAAEARLSWRTTGPSW